MLTKHYLAKAYMNRQNESALTDLFAVPLQLGYAVFWDFWHVNSPVSSLDTGKIGAQNFYYYKKHRMTVKDREKANKITLSIYESLIKSNFFTVSGKNKQYYSYIYDRYFEYIDLPRVFVQVHSERKLKDRQEIRIKFDANQVKSIESDNYLTILNQSLAKVDDNLTVLEPTASKGWYIYRINDNSVNYRIDLSNFQDNDLENYSIWLDGGHKWRLDKQYGAIIAGSSGTGKTSLLFSMIYLLMQKSKKNKSNKNIEIWVCDGKNDTLGAVMSQILPRNHVAVGVETTQLVHKLVEITDKRYQYMSKERKKNSRLAFANFDQFGFKMIAVFIDEQSAITASLADSKAKKQYQNDLLRLVQTSRGAGIIPIISMQQANANSMGGNLGTAIREQLGGLKIVMGTANTITTQDKQMIFNESLELPPAKFNSVGVGYLQTADMASPESFQAPLLPERSEDLYKLLSSNK